MARRPMVGIERSAALPVAVVMGLAMAIGATPTLAGGLYLQEFMDSSMGVATAGAQAVADDASTAFHNPAGLTRLRGQQLTVGAGGLLSRIKFDADPDTPIAGNDGGQIGSFAPILSLKYAHELNEDFRFGLSLISISGAALDYDDEWAGRFQNQEVTLMTLSAIPTLAYRINDQWSVGAGANILYGVIDMKVAVPPPDGTGRVKIEDADDVDVGFVGGVLFEPTERTRVGLTYQTKVEPKFSGNATIEPIGAEADIDLKLPLVEALRLGAYHELDDQWALLGSVRWENWSQFGSIPISTGRGSNAIPTKFSDTYGVSLGVHYRPDPKWLLQAGFGYDTNPVSDKNRNAAIPSDRQLRYAAGVQYQMNERASIGGSVVYADYGDNDIDSPLLEGQYRQFDLFVFGLYLNYKFGGPGESG